MNSDSGRQVFPQGEQYTGIVQKIGSDVHGGMTLRDYFAAMAMQARMTAFCAMETWHGWSNEAIAKESYALADAMLAERAK